MQCAGRRTTDTAAVHRESHLQKQESVLHKLEDTDSSALSRQLQSRLHGDESTPCRHQGICACQWS